MTAVSAGRRRERVTPRQLAVFTRHLAVLLDAGVPLVSCLDLLARDAPASPLGNAVARVRHDVEGGAALADAMRRQPDVFGRFFTQMIAVGEAGGVLDQVLVRLAAHIEGQARLQAQVRAAMIYPAIVLGIAAVVLTVILWKVIPTFAQLFAGLSTQLPWATRMVIAGSRGFVLALPLAATGVVAGGMLLRRYYATPAGRLAVDGALLQAPGLGSVLRKVSAARVCRTLGTLLTSGVPLLTALDVTARTSGNAAVDAAIVRVRQGVERGETLAAPLRAARVFPAMVVQMIGIGEMSGTLDVMLGKIADFYEADVDVAVGGLLTALEPLMIAGLGLVVGIIVVSMYLPLFDLISQLS